MLIIEIIGIKKKKQAYSFHKSNVSFNSYKALDKKSAKRTITYVLLFCLFLGNVLF